MNRLFMFVTGFTCGLILCSLTQSASAQTAADSVTMTFRVYRPVFPTMYLPGQFNGWNPSSPISQMTFNSLYGAWIKTYTWKIHDPADPNRNLGDSIYQYKFNNGGWFSDSLNPETNPNDNSNSVLRLTNLRWFELYGFISGNQYIRIAAGLIHANNDTITSIKLSSGTTQSSAQTTIDVTAGYNDTTRILDYTLPTSILKTNFMRLVAYDIHHDSTTYSQGGYVRYDLPMPTYAKNGVTLPSVASHDSTTFRLRVTGKDYVLIRLDTVGRSLSSVPPIVMRHATNNTDWWMNVKLAPGTYEYVYEIENGKQIYDPWGRQNGTYGSRFTVGPEGLTADNYVWQNTSFQRPPMNKLFLYEMNLMEVVGGYTGKSPAQINFTDLIPLLGHYQALGVNGIELMPITDYGAIGASGFSWGYDISSFLSLEPQLGSPADFKTLVDSAHGRGIAILLDVVYNHLNDPSPLWQMQPDEAANPYFKLCTDLRPNEDGLCYFKDVDHWAPETQELIYTALKMWIDDYKVDGFRYDYTQGIGWSRYDTTHGILGWANHINRDYNGAIYQIAEHLPESPALLYYSGLTSDWHDSFHDEVFALTNQTNIPNLTNIENFVLDLQGYYFYNNDTPSVPSVYANRTEPVNMTVNHDEQSLVYEMTTFQGVSQPNAILRDKLYATLMFTSLGIPMLFEGMEHGESRGWTNDGQKLSYRPVQAALDSTIQGSAHLQYYQTLAMQRTHNPALYNGLLNKLFRYTAQRVLVWGFNDSTTNSQVMSVANFSNTQQTVTNVPWLASGTWYNIFDHSIFTAGSTTVDSITIPANTALVYSNRSDSSLGIVTDVKEFSHIIPEQFALSQNYPNPFNPTTQLQFAISKLQMVTLKVYDVLGREVATLLNETKSPGTYTVDFDGAHLTSGVYFYKLTAGNFSEVRKMLLIR
jgi:1,4-alpha-glucan branching enzyme